MKAFRLLALAYALAALLIAPSWLAADELVPAAPTEAVQAAADEEPAPDEPAANPEADEPATALGAADEAAPAAEPQAQSEPQAAEPRKRESEPKATAAQSGSVTITDFEFTPATITVNVGDTVTWTNRGPTMHTATANDGSFDTGNLDEGESGSATFNSAGTISYICTPHPFMTGRVVVRAASSGTGGDAAAPGGGDSAAAPGTEADAADDGSGLPATGGESLLIAALGLATLAAGIILRRRSEA